MRCRLGSCFLAVAFAVASVPSTVRAQWDGDRADAHAPIGVMGDHLHAQGEWMTGYRFMSMFMRGNRMGSSGLSPAQVRARGYMVVPTSMDMLMHMFGAMFAPTDWVTLTLMVPVLHTNMEHQAGMPLGAVRFSTEAAGLGDIVMAGLIRLVDAENHRLHLNAGVMLPSGAIHVRDDTPMMANARLPYPMRLGSGAFGVQPGLTYLGQVDSVSWGAQVLTVLPLYKNEDGYRSSFEGVATAWGAIRWLDWLSTSIRISGTVRTNLEGADSDLNPALVPTADPDRRGLRRLDALLGVNFYLPYGDLRGHRLALEAGLPFFQDVDGPQLETDFVMTAGWQWAFR